MCPSCIRDISYSLTLNFTMLLPLNFPQVLSKYPKIVCISIEIKIFEGSRGKLYKKQNFVLGHREKLHFKYVKKKIKLVEKVTCYLKLTCCVVFNNL